MAMPPKYRWTNSSINSDNSTCPYYGNYDAFTWTTLITQHHFEVVFSILIYLMHFHGNRKVKNGEKTNYFFLKPTVNSSFISFIIDDTIDTFISYLIIYFLNDK